jgi:hypothetical protein
VGTAINLLRWDLFLMLVGMPSHLFRNSWYEL